MNKHVSTSLNQLADSIVTKYNLEAELSKPLCLDKFLTLVSTSLREFMELVLGQGSDPNKQLFFQDEQILALLPEVDTYKADFDRLREAMFYSLHSDGKMLRPALVFIGGILTKAKASDLLIAAMAVECVHTYSLIHDDLPAMDNDDYRRGKLTNHKVFGEDMAILAGDALQTLAFSLLSSNTKQAAQNALAQVQVLAYGAGHYGMCLGQALDILGDDITIKDLEQLGVSNEQAAERLMQIHYRKTAFLIRSSILLGVYASEIGLKTKELADLLAYWAYSLGLTFQIKDDLLDILGNQEETGKPVGSDVANHKLTFVSLFSLDKAQVKLEENFNKTISYIREIESFIANKNEQVFSTHALEWLKEITTYVVNRKK
ncbi:hypothetical protein CKF54_04595 [Psittacicella hinzii]|uniref:Farnesyl diphosphate synthase n=1 Tax=Psittacicella hinzii TaxID=2028575 RepID=A0A3A1Y2V0_9GAMM|nr:polyprenyl synthetase family protein [Psittacicella hinzii]RIY32553.1 hypothetical protein CKF54_04595 [Psittacicella hinzii]